MKEILKDFGIKVNQTVNTINDVVGEAFNLGVATATASILHHMYKARDNEEDLQKVISEIQQGYVNTSEVAELIGKMIEGLRKEET